MSHFFIGTNKFNHHRVVHDADEICTNANRFETTNANIDLGWHDNYSSALSYAESNFSSLIIDACPYCAGYK